MKLTNELVLKLFIDNFKELATLAQVKSACIKCQKIKRASPYLRARLFTRRACTVDDIYHELGKRDPAVTDEQIS
jgi:hypothetical protein